MLYEGSKYTLFLLKFINLIMHKIISILSSYYKQYFYWQYFENKFLKYLVIQYGHDLISSVQRTLKINLWWIILMKFFTLKYSK